MTAGKTIALTRRTFVGKVISVLFNVLSKVCHSFSSKEQASFNFMATVTICYDFGAPQIKSVTVSIICHEVMGSEAMILVFGMLSFKPMFSLFSFTFIKRLFSSSLLYTIRVVISEYLRLLIFLPSKLKATTIKTV